MNEQPSIDSASAPMPPVAQPYVRTTYAVWEITLKCNLACSHCGSRAGDTRSDELSTAEALDLVHQMEGAGIREVSLIGGEAFLRKDWLDIAREITKVGMRCTMTTGGYGINAERARRMKDAGIRTVSVSVDGLAKTHDRLRGKLGSFRFALETMGHLRAAEVPFGANTQICRRTAAELPRLYERLRDTGIRAWQLQLTVPMGNAADHQEILMRPHELNDLYPMIAELAAQAQRDGIEVQPGNNIGYYGPYERQLRGRHQPASGKFWTGCQAGMGILGIEANGAIKGCPSLPTAAYTGGNIRDRRLRDIMDRTPELTFNETQGTDQATDHLWGFCGTCEYASVCRGGCSWTSHVFFDRRGNNPYCHHRALSKAGQGIRESFVQLSTASGRPFDNGCFELTEAPLDSPLAPDRLAYTLDSVQWPQWWLEQEPGLVTRLKGEKQRAIDFYRRKSKSLAVAP